MLQQYGPDLLIQCKNVSDLSKELVQNWLTKFMFKGLADGAQRAADLANWLADHAQFKMHGRHIGRDALKAKGLKIVNLEDDKQQQDFILSIYHATTHTMARSGAVKIIENHRGNAFIEQVQQVVVQQQMAAPNPPPELGHRREEPPFPKKKGR